MRKLYNNWPLFLIIFAALTVRLLFYKSIDGAITTSDTVSYAGSAANLFYKLQLDIYRPPIYPVLLILGAVLLSWKNLFTGAIVLQILISLVNIIIVYKLTQELSKRRLMSYCAALITAISFKVYSWDFVILTENLSMLTLTLIAYFLVLFVKSHHSNYLKAINLLLLLSLFLKPFFLALPIVVYTLLCIRYLYLKDFDGKSLIRGLSTGFIVIYLCVIGYSCMNYAQNGFFGISAVGNVNYFGKILQYKMEDRGGNANLKEDIKYAFSVEKPEFKVNGEYLEPWHFIGTYGWAGNYYRDVGSFAREIMLKNPIEYVEKSIKLAYRLFAHNSPFNDYIADAAVIRAGHPDKLMLGIKRMTQVVDSLHIILAAGVIESIFILLSGLRKKNSRFVVSGFPNLIVLSLIIYHYIISAFFSYGDYCRLLVPSYPLIYAVMCIYIYRITAFTAANIKVIMLKIPVFKPSKTKL